jgi:hypothetical protein
MLARATLDNRVTEKDFLQSVKDLARLLNWRVYHCRDSRGSDRGLCDLLVVRSGVLHGLELKTMRGRVTRDQAGWLEDLGAVHRVTADVYRPDMWPRIVELLRGEVE